VDNPVGNTARSEPSWAALHFAQKMNNTDTVNKNNTLHGSK
jgi:hypothetical protein